MKICMNGKQLNKLKTKLKCKLDSGNWVAVKHTEVIRC